MNSDGSGSMCPSHKKSWDEWMDYRLPPPPITLLQVGRPSARGIQEQQEARYREWKDTMNFQLGLIAGWCRDGVNCSDDPDDGRKAYEAIRDRSAR